MAEEKQKIPLPCPICGEGHLVQNPSGTMVCCSRRKVVKQEKEFISIGECDFFIPYKQKAFGMDLNAALIRKLIAGEKIKNKNGDIMILDTTGEDGFYTHIEFKERKSTIF